MRDCNFVPNAGEPSNGCCVMHDFDYGPEGTVSRKESDRQLRNCVASCGHPVYAWLGWIAVRSFGWIWWKGRYKRWLPFIARAAA